MDKYFLHVDLVVPTAEDKVKSFEDKMRQFLQARAFRRIDPTFRYSLKLALKNSEPFLFRGYAAHEAAKGTYHADHRAPGGNDERCYRYVHLWSIPDLHNLDLATAMTLSSEDGLYREIDALVVSETQNFVVRAASTAAHLPALRGARQIIRATRHFSSQDVQEYLYGLDVLAPILAEDHKKASTDWHSVGVFQNVTGSLNTVVEFWETERGDQKPDGFDAAVFELGRKLQTPLVEPFKRRQAELREVFRLAPYFDGPSA